MRFVFYFLFCCVLLVTTCLNAQSIKAYANYDFIPGDKIIFEDDFSSGTDGEFPPMWKLYVGQGVVNTIDGRRALVLTDGNYAIVEPRIKKKPYLGNNFTVEFDFFVQSLDDNGPILALPAGEDELTGIILDNLGNAATHFMGDINLNGTYPDAENQPLPAWHHVAVAYKDGQLKCYVDSYRVLVVPQTEYQPSYVRIAGGAPVKIANVRIALDGGMNMLDQITKDGKIITHGILFESGKADLKPASMGVLNEVAKMLRASASLQLSVEGHTDSDGDDASNMKLSELRAGAVVKQLIALGIDGGRLSSKGWGESKPLQPNTSPEGKANNRRVEFVKR